MRYTAPEMLPRAASRHSVEIAALVTAELDQIGQKDHQTLYGDLKHLQTAMNEAVSTDPWNHALRSLHLRLTALHQAVLEHMHREDHLLFPWLRSGRIEELRAPVRGMRLEHESFAEELERLAGNLEAMGNSLLLLPKGPSLVAALHLFDKHLRNHMDQEDRLVYARVLDDVRTADVTAAPSALAPEGAESSDRWNASLK